MLKRRRLVAMSAIAAGLAISSALTAQAPPAAAKPPLPADGAKIESRTPANDLLTRGAGKRNAAQFAEAVDNAGAILSTSANLDAYGSSISAATRQDISKTIARIYPQSENLTFVFIGQADAIRETVKEYGPVTEMKISDPKFAP